MGWTPKAPEKDWKGGELLGQERVCTKIWRIEPKGGMNMKNRSRLVLPLAVIALCCSLGFIGFPVSHVYGAEGGGNHYPGGNEDFMAGALPPPGTYFLNYLDFFNSHPLNNNQCPMPTASSPRRVQPGRYRRSTPVCLGIKNQASGWGSRWPCTHPAP